VIGGGRFGLRNLPGDRTGRAVRAAADRRGLFLRSLQQAASVDVGLRDVAGRRDRVDFRSSGFDDERSALATAELVRRIGELPGRRARRRHGAAAARPRHHQRGFEIPGVEPPPGADFHGIEYTPVTPGFLETMEIPVLSGRGITDFDRADGQRVAS
jgi:hypothetical protein